MLETYFGRPQTVDRIWGLWIGPEIERYVAWLAERGHSARSVVRCVPLLAAFGEFAWLRGARSVADLPGHVDALFVSRRVGESGSARRDGVLNRQLAREIRSPVEHMLEFAVPGFKGTGRPHRALPFAAAVPGFFGYLAAERGLRPASVVAYRHHLGHFQAYLQRTGVGLPGLSPVILTAFAAERSRAGLAKTTVRQGCSVLREFLRYARREGLIRRDLASAVEWPQVCRLAGIPRSVSWEEAGRVLDAVDTRTPCGKRDHAILLLLVTYGLRGREAAALTLDDIDWKRERLAVPERKAGHWTAFPPPAPVGEALASYLRHGRPKTTSRRVLFTTVAPLRPIRANVVSACARRYLLAAGIEVPRPGSHTLRHTLVQRLADADFSLKAIGDFAGHRSPASTEIYTKVAVEPLRQAALGDGEEALR